MTNYLILDCEATGTNDGLALDEPVSIVVTDERGNVRFTTLLKPTFAIPAESTAVHGITNGMVADAPTFPEVLPHLMRVIDGQTLVMWNAAFDVKLLITAAHVHQVMLPRFVYRCAMLEYAALFGQKHATRDGEFKWWKLATAYEQQFAMTPDAIALLDSAHDAAADCRITADLVRLMELHGLSKTHGDTFDVLLTKVTFRRGKNNHGYLAFQTVAGQTVNVFEKEFHRFKLADYDIYGLLNSISTRGENYEHTLRSPIEAQIFYKEQFAEIRKVTGLRLAVSA